MSLLFSFYDQESSSPESEDDEMGGAELYDEDDAEGSTFYYEHEDESRSSTPEPSDIEPLPPAIERIPFELWELIFGFVAPCLRDDSYPPLKNLLNCALTCRQWSYMAIPMLYKTHGYGVFMPDSSGMELGTGYFPISRKVDFWSTAADRRMMRLWRTLLLSCFTVSRSSRSESTGATKYPYISYVTHLDARTLVMVLTEIMKSQRGVKTALGEGVAEYFFGGLLGGLEIAGALRGDRMIVGGSEYDTKSPVYGRDVKIFVGDTALMIMDFLYPHIHHLKGFTIPELGQLRTLDPVRMSHPISLICSLENLSRLVISSGWMVCPELGKAIAEIRPTLVNRSFSRPGRQKVKADTFCLTILDWRFKTHYDPIGHSRDDDWKSSSSSSSSDRADTSNWSVGALERFFDALNPNSVTSLDLDFNIQYSRLPGKDLGAIPFTARQSGSITALRLARMSCGSFKLWRMLVDMGAAGFVPQALKLIDLIMEDSATESKVFSGWNFAPQFWRNLRTLECKRFTGMFGLVSAAVEAKSVNSFDDTRSRCSYTYHTQELEELDLAWEDKHLGAAEKTYTRFFTVVLPSLGASLTSLKLNDTSADSRPGAIRYPRSTVLPRSPLEALTKLQTLVLSGDVSVWLLSDRTRDVMRAMRSTIVTVDICLSTKDVRDSNLSKMFSPCERLERLVLRAWDKTVLVGDTATAWIEYPPLLTNARYSQTSLWPVCPKLTAQGVRHYLKKCKRRPEPYTGKTVLREFALSKAFACDKGTRTWAEVRDLMRHRGGRFLPKVDTGGRERERERGGQAYRHWDDGMPALSR